MSKIWFCFKRYKIIFENRTFKLLSDIVNNFETEYISKTKKKNQYSPQILLHNAYIFWLLRPYSLLFLLFYDPLQFQSGQQGFKLFQHFRVLFQLITEKEIRIEKKKKHLDFQKNVSNIRKYNIFPWKKNYIL